MMIQISSLESLMTYKSKESHKSNGMTYDLQLTPPMVIGVCKSYIRLSLANSNKPMDTGDIASDGLGRNDLRTVISHLLSTAPGPFNPRPSLVVSMKHTHKEG